ncbi:uncharacterized protein [Pocillopora verrucosa]|uniref:uncharacterized protein n=1 Tax=Pocillopora verrucosa TaxID=203993 RepID=UPI003342A04E
MAEIQCVVFTTLLLLSALTCVSGKIGKCEKIKIPLCQGIGYNFTSMPNMFNHDTQEEAALEVHQFWPFVEIKCSADLKLFLCSMFAPNCQANVKKRVPPCRSICERARDGCARLMRQYGFSWPKRMRCKTFPEHGGDEPCMEGNGIVANGTSTTPHPLEPVPLKKTTPFKKCEKIKVPLCQGIGYNFTYMPNMFNHDTQEEAALEVHQFWPLVEIKCSADLKLFLCSIYTPICQPNYRKEIPPCRSLCQKAREGCAPLMRQYGFSWPKRMRCENFPKLGQKICIGPNRNSAKGSVTTPLPSVTVKKCRRIKIPFCQGIGYNRTSLPKIKDEDAVYFQQLRPLFGCKCSPNLKLFLCSMYAPECRPNVTDPLPPCRSTCKQAKRGCAPFMRLHHVRWPKRLRCKNFPKAGGKKSCIDPNGIVHKGA